MRNENGKHEELELIRRGYDAWNRGDIRAVIDLTHPDFRWDDPPEIVGARGGKGRRAFERYLRSFAQVWDVLRCEPEEYWTAGELLLVVVTGGGRGKRSGAWVERRFFHVWTIRDGRAARMEGYVEEHDALERLKSARRPALSFAPPRQIIAAGEMAA
jgi:hypothetical protein